MMSRRKSHEGQFNRRAFLTASGVGFCGYGLPNVLAAMTATPQNGRRVAKSTILIWLSGGPSHIDLWDMKPNAPAEYRGEFQPIDTTAPDIQLCEHLPHLAKQAHHLAIVRSLGHYGRGPNDHHPGYYYNLTGHPPGPSFPNSRQALPDDWPYIGSVVDAKRPAHPYLPQSIWLPDMAGEPGARRPGQFGGLLGVQHDPVYFIGSHKDPMKLQGPALTLSDDVTRQRLQDRTRMMNALNQAQRSLDRSRSVTSYSKFQEKTLGLLTSAKSKAAWDVTQEPESVRERYGPGINAMSMLAARRLVEAEVPFVTVYWKHDYEEDKKRGCLGGAWDTHWKNFSCLKEYLLPMFDRPFAALLDDLHERGLLEDTLVVVTSEMGRNPKIGDRRSGGKKGSGRDHWTHCMSILFAGGGICGGQVYGASDKVAAYPYENQVSPEDISKTIYHAMGIDDLTQTLEDGRTINLMDEGNPIMALF